MSVKSYITFRFALRTWLVKLKLTVKNKDKGAFQMIIWLYTKKSDTCKSFQRFQKWVSIFIQKDKWEPEKY